jgi:putative spermidine/putrescine transport system permease protein
MIKKSISYTLGIIFLMPIAFLIMISLAENWRFPALVPEHWTLQHWSDFFNGNQQLLTHVARSLCLSSSVAFVVTIIGFFVSKQVQKQIKSDFLLKMAYIPYSFSPVIYAFCVHFLFLRMGLGGTILGVWIAQFLLIFPFIILLFSSHWTKKMLEMEDIVATFGGTTRQAFWLVMFPMSKNILLLAFFQSFLISWFDFGLVGVIGLGKIKTLTIITCQFVSEANLYFAAISSLLTLIPPLILLWINRNLLFKTNFN